MRLLNRAGRQQGKPGLAARHHIRVVAENRERVGGDRAGGDVHAVGGQLARDLVHVGDEQEQALGGGKRGGESPGLERTVDRAGGAALGLHLGHLGDGAPDVLPAECRPLVGPLAHVGRGGNRIDRDHLVGAVGHRGCRLVPIESDHATLGHDVPPSALRSRQSSWGADLRTGPLCRM